MVVLHLYLIIPFIHFVVCQESSPENYLGYVPAPNQPHGRGTIEILYGCLFTLFVCFWSVQHPNLDKYSEHPVRNSKYKHKLPEHILSKLISKFLKAFGWGKSDKIDQIVRSFAFRVTTIYLGICGPEFLLSWAFTEWCFARELRTKVNQKWEQEWHKRLMVRKEQDKPPQWTTTHGFCAIMRGFAVQHAGTPDGESGPATERPWTSPATERPWTIEDLNTEDRKLQDSMQQASKADLDDKSKADWTVRIVAAFQIIWFLTQQIARYFDNLPRTQLEVATIAYVLCTLPAMMFYYDKPNNMNTPFIFNAGLKKYGARGDMLEEDSGVNFSEWGFMPLVLRDRYPGPQPQSQSTPYALASSSDRYVEKQAEYMKEVGYWACFVFLAGTAFGMVHLLGWNTYFPYTWQAWLWRGAILATIGIPLFFAIRRIWQNPLGPFRRGSWENHSQFGWDVVIARRGFNLSQRLAFWVWASCRTIIIVMLFVSLSIQPAQVYDAVDWTKHLPHFH